MEDWLPTRELSIESRRESAPIPGQFPKLKTLHVWWARRPLVASAAAVLGSLLPAWNEQLAEAHPERADLASEGAYRKWFLRLCGVWGDPVAARAAIDAALAKGKTTKGNAYRYRQAFKNSPAPNDIALLHSLLINTWGELPSVLDPTAGGGSIPFEAARYGLRTIANDLNPVAAGILQAGVQVTTRYGTDLGGDLRHWGRVFATRLTARLEEFFQLPYPSDRNAYLYARTVACPHTGKPVPLAPNWWLSKARGKQAAVRLITERGGRTVDAPEFQIVTGDDIDFDPDRGTTSGGKATSPWSGLVIDGAYIKAEAQARRMGSLLYAVAVRTHEGKSFRAPADMDLACLQAAEAELERLLPAWDATDVLPTEAIPEGNKTREPHNYGMARWRDMFTPRQLLVHGSFVEEYRRLMAEVRAEIGDRDRADAILAVLAMMQGKALNYNAILSRWDPGRGIRNNFERHDFAFKWTHAEFHGSQLWEWCLSQILDAYEGIAALLESTEGGAIRSESTCPVPGPVTVTCANAGNLRHVAEESQTLVCVDPPYYDNVMYAELADFFYVWEKRTLGHLGDGRADNPFTSELCDKRNEAVANPARFAEAGRRRKQLANDDYEAKMTAIFAECRRVLRPDGVLCVMFTHKRTEAWDTLGMSLLQAGFSIETSWPVATESQNSLHQARQNAASSTIVMVCRKRAAAGERGPVFFEDLEPEVRSCAREALQRFAADGMDGVDLMLSSYGPALSVLSAAWPVYSSEPDPVTGAERLLRPEEALGAARAELVRLQRQRLLGRHVTLDQYTDFVLLAWEIFAAREFPFDEARRLALAVGGLDTDELTRAKILTRKSANVVLNPPAKRLRRPAEAEGGLSGVYPQAKTFTALIDAVHTAIHVATEDGPTAAKTWMDRGGHTDDGRFTAAIEGLAKAMPRTRTSKGWNIAEAEMLDTLCRLYFPDIHIPEPPETYEAAQLVLGQQPPGAAR